MILPVLEERKGEDFGSGSAPGEKWCARGSYPKDTLGRVRVGADVTCLSIGGGGLLSSLPALFQPWGPCGQGSSEAPKGKSKEWPSAVHFPIH